MRKIFRKHDFRPRHRYGLELLWALNRCLGVLLFDGIGGLNGMLLSRPLRLSLGFGLLCGNPFPLGSFGALPSNSFGVFALGPFSLLTRQDLGAVPLKPLCALGLLARNNLRRPFAFSFGCGYSLSFSCLGSDDALSLKFGGGNLLTFNFGDSLSLSFGCYSLAFSFCGGLCARSFRLLGTEVVRVGSDPCLLLTHSFALQATRLPHVRPLFPDSFGKKISLVLEAGCDAIYRVFDARNRERRGNLLPRRG